jgi:hypothetical protein
MTHLLKLGVADLAGTRFATSPLGETVRAVLLMGDQGRSAVNRPWLDWARSRLDEAPLRLARTWPLIVNGLDMFPEFLVPAPAGQRPGIADELARVRATREEAVRASLHRVFGTGPWPDSARELLADRAGSLREISAELECCYDRLIAPHAGHHLGAGPAVRGHARGGIAAPRRAAPGRPAHPAAIGALSAVSGLRPRPGPARRLTLPEADPQAAHLERVR